MHEINKIRKNARMTVDELCSLTGIDRTTYYRKVNGKSEFTVKEIEALCKVLKVRPSIFFTNKVS